MPECVQCGVFFPQKIGLRPMKFCGHKCRDKYHKHLDYIREPANLVEKPCDICGTKFQQTKRNQRYCSTSCYKKAWAKLNPEKNREMSAKRRKAKPEWYALREPRYYKQTRQRIVNEYPWAYLLKSRRLEAKKKYIPFDLDNEWAAKLWPKGCAITGLAFQPNKARGPWPFSPSIDQIKPGFGYTKQNSRFVLWGCNALKGVGTDEDMVCIAKAITKHFSS